MDITFRYRRWRYNHIDAVLANHKEGDSPFRLDFAFAYIAQRVLKVVHGLIGLNHLDYAAQLSFNTLMAIIPVFAIIFAIGKGFGFEENIANFCHQIFSNQRQVGDAIISLSHSYILYAQSGWFIGLTLIFMLYSVIMLIRNIEIVFNRVWNVAKNRSLQRTLVDYAAMIFAAPIFIILFSGMTVFFSSIIEWIPSYHLWGSFARVLMGYILPLLILWLFFVLLFIFVPNTKVKFIYSYIPAFLAAIFTALLQKFFLYFQFLFAGYNFIYGSLAALPLFLLWLQFSWYIILGFVELCHANQELDLEGNYEERKYSFVRSLENCAAVLRFFCERKRRGADVCDITLIQKSIQMPYPVLRSTLALLVEARLLSQCKDADDVDVDVYLLRVDSTLTYGHLIKAVANAPYLEASMGNNIPAEDRERVQENMNEFIEAMNRVPVYKS